jgi:hypothetical protein
MTNGVPEFEEATQRPERNGVVQGDQPRARLEWWGEIDEGRTITDAVGGAVVEVEKERIAS